MKQTVMRQGKTKKDHTRGVWSNRFGNRDARVSWQHNSGQFPKSACNGKRNRQK